MSKKRWTLFAVLIAMSLACLVSVMRMGAANPTSGMISPGSPPLSWNGTAAWRNKQWRSDLRGRSELRYLHADGGRNTGGLGG